ncbi:hypothetical protein ACOKFD_16505 [Flagellimonas sp. S174]|uniref:hypothetical protein n=1 Tax=Flagellimonas sp. S174 TaxID=3410790 RepID=UPI003BF46B89
MASSPNEDSIQVLEEAKRSELYEKLVAQLKKDFELANIRLNISDNPSPEKLKTELHEKVYRLILEQFPEYLNLLYIVDVSEDKVREIETTDVVDMAEAVSFLILKREWMKVSLRRRFET